MRDLDNHMNCHGDEHLIDVEYPPADEMFSALLDNWRNSDTAVCLLTEAIGDDVERAKRLALAYESKDALQLQRIIGSCVSEAMSSDFAKDMYVETLDKTPMFHRQQA